MPLPAVETSVEQHDLSKIAARAKRATVTMMLAERIVRNDWSVDGEHLVVTNAMNVWQTLELLSGANIRKKYHYEGYNDINNAVSTLTPSWRRDSYVEKKEDGAVTPRPDVRQEKRDAAVNREKVDVLEMSIAQLDRGLDAQNYQSTSNLSAKKPQLQRKSVQLERKRSKRVGKKKTVELVEIDPVFNMSPLQYTDIIKCK